uniref:Uncharacterized protein n=1 Tax=Phlebotomus papatasi TaxID=29031 RepID=A0A1B0D784_PHLPP
MYERQLFELGIIMEPGDIAYHSLRNFRLPLPASIPEAFRTSKILLKSSAFLHLVFYRNVTKRDLSEKNFYQWLYDLSRYLPPIADTARWTVECDPEAPYRSINGTCNSLTNPLAGSTLTTFSRITLPWYYDDIHAIRKGSDLRLLAAPRNIVVYLFRNRNPYEDSVDKLDLSRMPNIASLMFGQIIAHDVAQQIHTQNLFSDDGIQCCDRRNSRVLSPYERNPACIPIEISPRDPDYQAHSIGCVNLLRSETISPFGRTLSAAQQVNHATAYFDLSNVYGGTELDSNNLRTFEGGRLIMNEDNILPEVPDCTSNACYLTGDTRVNETPFLTIFSSLFFRHHNRLCLILSTLNSHWDDERLFQEARRICIAQYQHVILNEFVPSFFGPKATDEVTFDFGEPDPRARATTANEFASCAYRIFHAFVPDNFIMVDRMGNEETITMSDSIRNTTILRTRYEPILQGMMRQRVNLEGFGQEILTKVFKSPERGDMGLDLLAADIQRGRDHGLNSYVKYLEYCGYKNIKTFDDLRVVLDYKIAYHSLRNFRLPLPASIPEAFRTSKILLKSSAFLHLVFYRNVTKRDLSEKNFYQWLYDLSRYLPPIADTARWTVECDPEAPYRSINGTCNSLTNPLAGSTLTTFSRITLPWYYDDIHAIRKGSDLRLLAAPRNIVVYLFRNRNPYEDSVDKLDFSRMPNIASLMFGQIIAHDVAQQIHTQNRGRLIMNEDNILPEVPDCTSNACYLTGDTRVNETPFLTIFSSLFFRHHNRLCLILSTLNSHWDDERLFQEARRICIAQYQHMILNEFVPSFFGPKATDEVTFDFGEPDPRARATTANEFASCAYRIFHAFVPDNFIMVDRMGNEETITMSDSIRNTTMLRTRYEPILQGMMRQRVNLEGFGQEILTKVFKSPERGDMGLDLLAADIQRGRDHGLNSYVKYLEYCGYKNIKTFDDLRVVLDYKVS